MIKPDSKFKKFWTIMLIFLLLYTAIVMPYKIALIDDDNDFFLVLDTTIDFLFMFDILVNLNSPIEEATGNYNYHRKMVVIKYLKSWFFVDIIACLPMNLISKYLFEDFDVYSSQNLIKFARIPKLYRLLRITRLFKILKILNRSIFQNKL